MFPHNNEGRNQLLNDYDTLTLQTIADNGCESGVCYQHIYYADTIAFFDKYEGEILDLIHIRYGVDTLVDIFKQHDACYNAYRNDCCWLFIENVATDVIIDNEELSEADDRLIEEYMKPLHTAKEDLMNLSIYNPPNSMTDQRYSQI